MVFIILIFLCFFGTIQANDQNHCVSRGRPHCQMTPVGAEGPYFIPDSTYRSEIREGQPGIKLELQFLFQDFETCKPIKGLNIHIWNTNASGIYSGGQGQGTHKKNVSQRRPPHDCSRYLRGIQTTDLHGIVNFTTIFPGWYINRSTHIHIEAFKDDNDDVNGTYASILYFSERLTKKVSKEPYYKENKVPRTKNAEDPIYWALSGWKLILAPDNIGKDFRNGMKASYAFGIKK